MANLVVKGFDETLKKLNGQYLRGKDSCGRPTFARNTGAGMACIYYWDEDDGCRGWWISPSVNSDKVWARNPARSDLPPRGGWHAPWESKLPNKNIAITIEGGSKRKLESGVSVVAKKAKTEEEIQTILTSVTETLEEIEHQTAPKCEEVVDKLKDTGVMFMCGVVDHMSPDEVLEMKTKADTTAKEAQEELSKCRRSIDGIRAPLEQVRSSEKYAEAKAKLDLFHKKIVELTKEVQKIGSDVNKGSQKAMAQRKLEKQAEQQATQRLAVQRATAFQIIVKPMKEVLKQDNKDNTADTADTDAAAVKSTATLTKEVRDMEGIVLAMLEVITKDLPSCSSNSAHVLRSTEAGLKAFLKQLREKAMRLAQVEDAKVDEMGSIVSVALKQYMEKEKLSEQEVFTKMAQGGEATEGQAHDFVSGSLELGDKFSSELTSQLFGRALSAASVGEEKEKETLTQEEFFMYFARALYSTRSVALDVGEEKKRLDDGDIVELIEGPVGKPLRARVMLMDGVTTGWLPFKVLQRLSPQFTVVADTVVTDKHELKGFSVVQRLTTGMKVVATKAPSFDPSTKLLRMPVVVTVDSTKTHGFVTVKGNRGAQLLKQEKAAAAGAANPVAAKEMCDEDWTQMVSEYTSRVSTELVSSLQEIVTLREDCEQKCATLEALAEGWTEEVLEETSAAAVAAWEKIDGLIQDLANKLVTQTKELSNVSADVPGPLSEVKSTVDDVQKKIMDLKASHIESTKKARQLQKKLANELLVLNKKKEVAKEEAIINSCIDEALGRQEVILGMSSRLNVEPEDEAGIVDLQVTMAEAEELVATVRKWAEETRKECQKSFQNCLAKKVEMTKRFAELSSQVAKLNSLVSTRKTKLTRMWADLVDTGAIIVAKALRDHMEMNQMSRDALFSEIATLGGDSTRLGLSSLVQFLHSLKLELSDNIIEKIFAKISPKGLDCITSEQFAFLTTCYYKVVKGTTLTDALSIKAGKRIATLNVDDCVEILGRMENDDSTGVMRVKVQFNDQEGFVTVKGNQGTMFLEPQGFYYKVTKDTVITNKFSMQQFQVVRRLKIGDILRARSLPKEEKQSGLWRLEVVVLLKKSATNTSAAENSGFVTMKGNQGTSFLESVSIDGMDVEEPVDRTETENVETKSNQVEATKEAKVTEPLKEKLDTQPTMDTTDTKVAVMTEPEDAVMES